MIWRWTASWTSNSTQQPCEGVVLEGSLFGFTEWSVSVRLLFFVIVDLGILMLNRANDFLP